MDHCCYKSPYRAITHVIFDLDGTLLDTEEIHIGAYKTLAKEYGKELTTKLAYKIKGSTRVQAITYFIQDLNVEADFNEVCAKFWSLAKEKYGDLKLCKGAEVLVQHLVDHKVPIAIATSTQKEAFEFKTANHQDFFRLFNHVVCGDDPDVYKSKPNPSIFLVAAKRFPKYPDPEECLVFEDSINGVKAGIRAGMQVVMVPDPETPYDDWKQATMRIDSLEQVPLLLFNLPPLHEPEKNSCWNLAPKIEPETQ